MHPLIQRIQNLRLNILKFPFHPESNIPLVTFIAKHLFKLNSITVIFYNKAFKLCKPSCYTYSLRLLALATQLLHLILCLNWFIMQYFQNSQDENWKSIYIMYCIALFDATSFTILHNNRVEKEVVILLNSSLLIESNCRKHEKNGNYIYRKMLLCHNNVSAHLTEAPPQTHVSRYFLLVWVCCAVTIIILPAAMSLLSFIKPCMPPLISSFLLQCPWWGHDGNSTFLLRIFVALFEFYTWLLASGIICVVVMIILMYPGEVKLLILADMTR